MPQISHRLSTFFDPRSPTYHDEDEKYSPNGATPHFLIPATTTAKTYRECRLPDLKAESASSDGSSIFSRRHTASPTTPTTPTTMSTPTTPTMPRVMSLKKTKSSKGLFRSRSFIAMNCFSPSSKENELERQLIQSYSMPSSQTLPQITIEDTEDKHKKYLSVALDGLQNDFTSGARQMGDAALTHLATVIDLASTSALTKDELWQISVGASKQLAAARPSMSAAIMSCVLRALDKISEAWNQEATSGRIVVDYGRIASSTIKNMLKTRVKSTAILGKTFTTWAEDFITKCLPAPQTTLNILTLSNSSTIRSALHTLLTTTPYPLTLTILESRPRFEGADMAAQLLASLEKDKNYAALSRLSISIDPDCTAAHHARSTHLLLLGADRISSSDGSVSNKIGSLPAALCVRHVNPRAHVVVLTDTDKIVRPGAEEGPEEVHPASEVQAAWSEATKEKLFGYERMPGGGSSISISSGGDARKEIGSYGGWFEWVPPELLDVYVTEAGVLDCKGVMRMGGRIQELEERIFGS
ncbi:nagb/rpia/CoA transferase-like protein [Corynespora cassiicola Philippines]|uniref:Nagb/rpia/CoA transferase-like protein n=1 Tax=Corynespora cassiicola Philippines TaxID=1448308 RepID=A0A2T2P799_CORCC|nr:nagb/rpia/CoA transferase-like protein [Corynespora cassiicola Philippines]